MAMLIACAAGCTGLKGDGDDDNELGPEGGEPDPKDSGDAPGRDAAVDGGEPPGPAPGMDAGKDSGQDAAGPGPNDGATDTGTGTDTGTPPADGQPAQSRCATDHGGCDENATCTDDPVDPSAAPSCECMPGFAGTGSDCSAVLGALALSVGTLEPALSPGVTSYTIAVPIDTERLTFTPTAPAPATIVFNDDAIVASGTAWQSPLLELGFNSFSATIQHSGHPDRDYVFNVIRGRQEAYLKGSGLEAQDSMGWDVAIDGDTAVVGAPGHLDDGPLRGGSVYVFTRSGASWSQQARLQGDAPAAGDYFGASVAIDGDTIAVGASGEGAQAGPAVPRRGAVYVFTRAAGAWNKQARLTASNSDDYDHFAIDVALAEDTLAAGALYEDSAQQGISTTAPADNGAGESGAVYVFTRAAGSWTQRAYLKASQSAGGDHFGTAVALSRDPTGALFTLVVGAPEDGVGAVSNAGSASIFRGSGASWSEEAFKTASVPASYAAYGASVAIDGDLVAVGAPVEDTKGKFYVYHRSSGAWQPRGPFAAAAGGDYDYFGGAVAVSGTTVAVGASAEDSSGTGVTASADELARESGALYMYTSTNGYISIAQSFYVKAARVDPEDSFGLAVAMSGSAVIVGARAESSSARTVDGDATDNGAARSGAAYIVR